MHTQATSKAAHAVSCIGCGTALPPECTTCPRCGRPVLLRTAAHAGPPPRTAGPGEPAQTQTRAFSALPRHFTPLDPNGARRWGLRRGTAVMLFGFALAFGTYIAIAEHENAQVKWRAIGGSVAKQAPSDTRNTAAATPNPAASDSLVALLAQQIASVRDEDAADAERLRDLQSQRGGRLSKHDRSSGETVMGAASTPSVLQPSTAAPASTTRLAQATPPVMPKQSGTPAPTQPPAQSKVQPPASQQQQLADATVSMKPAQPAQAQASTPPLAQAGPPAMPKQSINPAPTQPPAQSKVQSKAQSPTPQQQQPADVTIPTKPAQQVRAPASATPLAQAAPPVVPKQSGTPAPTRPPTQSMVQSPAPQQQQSAGATIPTKPAQQVQAPASATPLAQAMPPVMPKQSGTPAPTRPPAQSMVQSPAPQQQQSADATIPTKPTPPTQTPASLGTTRLAQTVPHAPHRRPTIPARLHPPARTVAQAPKSPPAATLASKRQAPILAEQLAEGPAAGCSGSEPIGCTTTRDAPVVTLGTPVDSHSEEHVDTAAGTRTEAETAADTRANTSATVSSGVVLRPEPAPGAETAPPSSSTAPTARARTPERTASASHRHPNATRHVRARTNTSPNGWPSWPQWLADLPHDTRREPPRQERDPVYHGR